MVDIDKYLDNLGIDKEQELKEDVSIYEILKDFSDKSKKYELADFQNYKKRVEKEKKDLENKTKIKMLESIIDVDNDINIGINSVEDEETKKSLKLISDKIEKFLKNHNVELIQTDEYDSDIHDVITVLNKDSKKIVNVISRGYTIDGKPFKYPKVILG